VALFEETHLSNIGSGQQESEEIPAGKPRRIDVASKQQAWPAGALTVLFSFASLILLGAAACNSGSPSSSSEKAASPQDAPAASTPAPTLSASELKEMQARDDYASKLSTTFRARFPAYKNVQIYADNWTGTKKPGHGPLTNIKTRTGDNLMLVFWSPDASTAKGLADFTKSRAAQDAVNAGFAELQFVDPGNYCYAQIAPVTGVGPVTCGIR
jgi:hypothetical protein